MTRRRWPRGPALWPLAIAATMALVLARPAPCLACSCVPPVSLAEAAARSPGLAVFVGRVVAMQDDATTGGGLATVAVDGRFRGPLLPPSIVARYGGGGDCTIGMTVGERRLFTASLDERGAWFPALCDPQGVLGTPEGDALLAEAVRTFGPAQPVGGPSSVPAAGLDLASIAVAVGAVVVLGTGLLVGLLVAGRRRGRADAA
jgi:hypothetical protein